MKAADLQIMINYTDRLRLLMGDIVSRVSTLSFIEMDDLLVFARPGRTKAEGAFATCHCLSLPPGEPAYYVWRDRRTGRITRRSEWFVARSPAVSVGGRPVKYMISFALPRFCDQAFDQSRKERFYPRPLDSWMAKLDTVVHELYHVSPEQEGIRRIERGDGTYSAHSHGRRFLEQVAGIVTEYLDSQPDPSAYDFLRHDFDTLEARYGGVVAQSFRGFPSFPQRFIDRLTPQPPPRDGELAAIDIEPIRPSWQPTRYTENDLHLRRFMQETSQRIVRSSAVRAA